MKIYFVNRFFYPDVSATAQILTDLAVHLAGIGRPTVIVTSRLGYEDSQAAFPPRESVHGVEVVRVATTRFGRANLVGRAADYLTFYVSVFWHLLRCLRRGDIVVAKTDPPLISIVAALAAKTRGARLVNWLQDIFPEVGAALGMAALRGVPGGTARVLRNASLRSAAANVALGERMAAYLRDEVRAPNVRVIENWVDDKAILPTPHATNPLRLTWKLEGKFVVAYSGNLGRAHDVQTILDAAFELRGHPDICFLFVGGGARMKTVKAFKDAKGLANIAFQPYQPREKLALSLNAGDLHLVSLRPELEGYIVPSKFYGIAAAGRPVAFVGDPAGEVGRLVAKHGIGESFRPGDSAGLTRFIRDLAANPGRAAHMGARARRALESAWTQRRALETWGVLLDTVANGPGEGW